MTEITGKLEFPASWHGTLIAVASAGELSPLIQQVFDTMKLAGTEITPANASKSGTYRTWRLSATIATREEMEALFRNLASLPGVKMLL